jgi:hypothetical protein
MRIGKWVPLYKRMLPIPQRLATSFGLTEGSELYLAPIMDSDQRHHFGCEVMVSPVPIQSWRSVCRLSVRLQDRPRALATATSFLRQERVNILLSETCSTYQRRAHWDALCDLSETPGFSQLNKIERPLYEAAMEKFLNVLTSNFHKFMKAPDHREAFLMDPMRHAQFSPLTGLNDAYFICDLGQHAKARYTAGGIELPESLASTVSAYCKMDVPALPEYAMITGNTEQRYLRVLFLKDHDRLCTISPSCTKMRRSAQKYTCYQTAGPGDCRLILG